MQGVRVTDAGANSTKKALAFTRCPACSGISRFDPVV
jgi:hypothetical protein